MSLPGDIWGAVDVGFPPDIPWLTELVRFGRQVHVLPPHQGCFMAASELSQDPSDLKQFQIVSPSDGLTICGSMRSATAK